MPRGHSNHRSSNQRRSLSYCLTHFCKLSSGLLSPWIIIAGPFNSRFWS